MNNLYALIGNTDAFVAAVVQNYLAMEEPGAEDVITFPEPRSTLVTNVKRLYANLTGIAEYKFPYSEAAVVDLHTKFRKMTDERKAEVLKHLRLKPSK